MPNTYKDFVVKVTIEQGSEGQVIITPFTRYQETVWCEGQDVTYSYRTDPKLLGKECVVFCQVIDEHPTIPSEVKKAEKHDKTLGISKVDVLDKAKPKVKLDAERKEVLDAEGNPVMELPTQENINAASMILLHVKDITQDVEVLE